MPSPSHALSLRCVSKSYGSHTALLPLDLDIPHGRTVGILGPNGAGKTTMLKLMAGLLRPSSGQVSVYGYDVTIERLHARRLTGYLGQTPTLHPSMTANDILALAARLHYRLTTGELRMLVEKSLDQAGLSDSGDQRSSEMSGGQRQRLALAQSLIGKPKLLLLDEPLAELDPLGRRDVLKTLEHLGGQTTVLYSTHILEDVEKVADMVLVLESGQLVALGSPQELIAGANNGAIVYTVRLRGYSTTLHTLLEKQDWVAKLRAEVSANDDNAEVFTLTISTDDPALLETKLLRLLLDDDKVVIDSFGKEATRLEHLFTKLVGGDRHA